MFNSQIFDEDVRLIIDLILKHKRSGPITYVEVGCNKGGTFCQIHNALHSNSLTIAIDCQDYSEDWNKLPLKRDNLNYFLVGPTSKTSQRVKELIKRDPHGQIDCLFIDGDHSEEGVKLDWETYKDLVAPGGLIIFHDWDPPSSTPFNSKTQGAGILCQKLKASGLDVKQLVGTQIGTSYLIK